MERANLRIGLAVGAAVVVGAATGWPVGAVLAGLAGWGAPGLLGGAKRHSAAVGRIEAIAGWAEMLRDTMAGSAGLEQAIVATAPLAPLPIRAEVATLAVRLEGERLAPALRAFADEVADPTCDLVVAALVLAAEHQAQRLGELLGSLGRGGPGPGHHAPAGRGRPGPDPHLGQGHRRRHRRPRGRPGAVQPRLPRPLRHRRRPARPRSWSAAVFATAFVWLSRMTRPVEVGRFLTEAPGSRRPNATSGALR